jgi:hypothetical protein
MRAEIINQINNQIDDIEANIIKINEELIRLRNFYKEVVMLTSNPELIGDYCVVSPTKLGGALKKVDPKWFLKKETK